jgi:predicted DNA-binding transcriptional regulator YafY
MPPSKNALLRYATIDACLQRRGRHWKFEDLRQAVIARLDAHLGTGAEVSVRTLREDLKNMRPGGATGYNAPIEFTLEQGYFYSEPDYSIFNSPLTIEDLVVLQQALNTLKQLQGLGGANELQEVVERLELRLSYQSELHERVILQFEHSPNYQGQKWLNGLYAAIKDQQAILLNYRPFLAQVTRQHVVYPYLLKQYNGRWFLVAQRKGQIAGASVFALDRIQGLEPAGDTYLASASDPTTFFEHLIGVSVLPGAEVVRIRLRFAPTRLPYVLTKPIHPSQQVEDTNNGQFVTLNLAPTRELFTLLLSFGADVEILEPLQLRQQLRAELTHALENYPFAYTKVV